MATFFIVHLCACSRGLILAPRHFWSWVIGMCSAFLYISHSLQENETKVYAPRPRERKRERYPRQSKREREAKPSRPIRFVTCRITWHVWQAKDMNIIKCNNYIFSSSKAMFKLRGGRCIRCGRAWLEDAKSGVRPSTKLCSGRSRKRKRLHA